MALQQQQESSAGSVIPIGTNRFELERQQDSTVGMEPHRERGGESKRGREEKEGEEKGEEGRRKRKELSDQLGDLEARIVGA